MRKKIPRDNNNGTYRRRVNHEDKDRFEAINKETNIRNITERKNP
jgi:stalled ribosome alternative rescue factor ArfA